MLQLNDEQRALILEAEAVFDASIEVFCAMGDATTLAVRLGLLEEHHRLSMREIELLWRAGDPATAEKRAREEDSYHKIRASYLAGPVGMTPAKEFEAARLAVLRGSRK